MLNNNYKSNIGFLIIGSLIWFLLATVVTSFIYIYLVKMQMDLPASFIQQVSILEKNIMLSNLQDAGLNFIDIISNSLLGLALFVTTFLSGLVIIVFYRLLKELAKEKAIREQINFVKLKERQLNKKIIQDKQLKTMQINRIIDQSTDCYIRISSDLKLFHANTSAKAYFNKVSNISNFNNVFLTDLMPDIKSTNFVQILSLVEKTQVSKTAEIYLKQQKRWILTRLYYEGGYVGVYFSDITSKKESAINIASGVSLLKQLLDTSIDSVALVDFNWKYQLTNQKWIRSFGLEDKEVQGKSMLESIPSFTKQLAPLQRELVRGQFIKIPEFQTFVLGNEEWMRFEVSPYRNEDDKISGFIISAVFTTQARKRRKQAEKQRQTERQLAYHDMLTGLPNRQLFHDRLSEALTNSYRNLKKTALLFIDLDGFKAVNDTLGHDVGDRLLQDVSQRLQEHTRASDTVARMGGDEFTVILTNIDDIQDVSTVADKIIKVVANPYDYGEGIVARVTASIGISMYPKDGSNSVDLIRHADESMYKAKNSGKNNYVFYESKGFEVSSENITLEDVKNALNQNDLLMHYQGYFDTEKQKVYGVEGLLRWNHAQYGLLRAGQFLPAIEQDDIMVEIGQFVLRKACQQIKEWEKEGQTGLLLTVNVSPREFQDKSLLKRLEKLIKEYDIKTNSLGFEISEKIILQNSDTIGTTLKAMKALGIVIIVEDLDKEGLSLNILKDNPIDMLKIDFNYIQGIGKDKEKEQAIISFIKMARTLGVEPAADCVETPEQEKFLTQNGCYKVQGYLFGRPSKPTKHFVVNAK
jgi:diguanylate cyclase (GGDEF)-like protein/PAS domain S-box-containing protein